MKSHIKNDKNASSSEEQKQSQSDARGDDYEKDRKIKRLTQINRELIETLKQQNDELTKKIQKQRLKGFRSNSVKPVPKNSKQLESIRKELSNAYKQIDMYQSIIQNLKAKEVSLDHIDKIYELQNKLKEEDTAIQNYQKQLKYLAGLKQKQQKQLKIFENEEAKQNKIALQKQITTMKEKLKALKKNANKRQEIEKRQHAYFVQLEKALRKINDQYYPGKVEPKKQTKDEEQINQTQWETVKSRLEELRKNYQENNKKLDTISRQKIRQLKSYEENDLKLKQKTRKLNMLRSRITELTKLTVLKQPPKESKQQIFPKRQEIKNDKNKIMVSDRQVKKWNVPQAFCLEIGKVLPNSTFSSDKQILDSQHKYKIVQAHAYVNGTGIPCLLHFVYQNQQGQRIEGKDMVQNIPSNLQIKTFKLKEKDYVWRINGTLKHGVLNSITFRSKLGNEATFEDENSKSDGQPFSLSSKPDDIPSCFFGALITTNSYNGQLKLCYLGFEFNSDW